MENIRDLSNTFKKYNLGCGDKIYKDFLNIGYWQHLERGQLYTGMNGQDGSYMLNLDLKEGIPAHDGSLDLVYHSHMLEHLGYLDGIAFIQECYRVLAPGGKMRILVPDLELWAKAYLSSDRFFLEEYQKVLDKDLYVTDAAIFMGMLHNHDHKCGYDFKTLTWVLERAGFAGIRRTLYASSVYIENVSEIEPYDALRAMESLCVECVKN
ncbi:class I SAM-dependent methyltransferase [Cupriavidus numazuensis]|uniref:Methyltransferase type 11 domain-containing protein n=1 Tax=Cupriavidus numazuensis TaxID=221992 RepID=A0ABM8TIW7_9BURK|nr:methyltransferase domain-containing protein [Cupriavidus numazuensis]CAG2148885.1 hypothetical protein LMG26411_03428 [Cupriavidus numazuensis]